jgi:hypothetical protein
MTTVSMPYLLLGAVGGPIYRGLKKNRAVINSAGLDVAPLVDMAIRQGLSDYFPPLRCHPCGS